MSSPQLSSAVVWLLSGITIGCVLSVIIGLNLTLGTRRRLGLYFVWIGAAVFICTAAGVILVVTHGP